jgi:hypothetical protein
MIDASVRDTPQIRTLQFPVFSRGVAPSTTIRPGPHRSRVSSQLREDRGPLALLDRPDVLRRRRLASNVLRR